MLVAPGEGEKRKAPFYFKCARVDFDVVFLPHRLSLRPKHPRQRKIMVVRPSFY